jgi:hypothetical protein
MLANARETTVKSKAMRSADPKPVILKLGEIQLPAMRNKASRNRENRGKIRNIKAGEILWNKAKKPLINNGHINVCNIDSSMTTPIALNAFSTVPS